MVQGAVVFKGIGMSVSPESNMVSANCSIAALYCPKGRQMDCLLPMVYLR